MMKKVAHVAVYDTLADWETGYLLVELHTGRFTGAPWDVVTVAESTAPITTMGGVRIEPDMALADLDPATSDLLVLAGATMWDAGGGDLWVKAARRFLDADVPVAAICGATAGLARAGLLDDRDHTSADPGYLGAQPGYGGQAHYVDARAVADRGLITAGPQSPVQFACATLGALELVDETMLKAYEGVFHGGDPDAFATLMQGSE